MANFSVSSLNELPRVVNPIWRREPEALAILFALATILDPRAPRHHLFASLRVVVEGLVRAGDRAVPAGTGTSDTNRAHSNLIELLRWVSERDRESRQRD